MPEASPDRTFEMNALAKRVLRHVPLVLVITLVVLIGSLAAGFFGPKSYTATANLTVSPISLDPLASSSTQGININTEREVLRSSEVARIASDSLKGKVDAATLESHSSVAAPDGSQVLEVSATAATPKAAAAYANALANAYLTFRAAGAAQLAQARIDEVDSRIAAAEKSGSASELADLRSERVSLEQVSQNAGRIIGVAQPPRQPSSLGLPAYLVGGLVAGILAGIIIALIRDLTDRRVRSADRLTELSKRDTFAVRDVDDVEGFRWIMRALRSPFLGRRVKPVVIAVFGLSSADTSVVVEGLRRLAVSTQVPVEVVGPAELPVEMLDQQWRYEVKRGPSVGSVLVLVDASHVDSGARRAMLADAADAAVLVAAKGSSTSELTHQLQVLDRTALTIVVPVFQTGSSRAAAPAGPTLTTREGTAAVEEDAPDLVTTGA